MEAHLEKTFKTKCNNTELSFPILYNIIGFSHSEAASLKKYIASDYNLSKCDKTSIHPPYNEFKYYLIQKNFLFDYYN